MSVFFLVISIIFWVGALAFLPFRPLYSPALSYLGLLGLSFCETDGIAWLPINNAMIISWLCITVVVMMATLLQPAAVRAQTRGMGYMIGGGIVGLIVGLLGFTVSAEIGMLYGIMIVATAVGIFFGFLLYSNTPAGSAMRIGGGYFFRYLLAKGFPTAVTLMQIGLVFVLLIALR